MTVHYNHASELATITNTWSVGGTATDPDTVTFVVTDPTGSATTYTHALGQITKSSTGVYTKDISCSSTVAGTWQAVLIGTGAAADVAVVTWETFDTDSQLYVTPEALKSRMGISDTFDDLEIREACESASRDVDDWCDRHFYRTTATRSIAARSYCDLAIPDLVSVTTLKTDGAGDGTFETTWTTSDYQLLPTDVAWHAEQRPYTKLKTIGSQTFPVSSGAGREDRVEIAGVWGWPQVPAKVKQAARLLAAETLKLKDAPFGVAGFGEFGVVRVQDNRKAQGLLRAYRKNPVQVG